MKLNQRATIRPNRLQSYCNMSIEQCRKLGKFTPCDEKDGSGYTFIDRGSSVLAVAHVDTVRPETNFKVAGDYIYSPRLDDRLGVYTIVEYLPSIGINMDVLLCENEESMRSTAIYFTTDKKYNWLCEFDRGGHDTVMYQYHDYPLSKDLTDYGFVLGWGSYSDIADLDHLGCSGINFSAGYYKYHTTEAYMSIKVWQQSVDNFALFYGDKKDQHYAFDRNTNKYDYGRSWMNQWGKDDDYSWSGSVLVVYCPECQKKCKESADVRLIDYFGCCSECLIDYDRYTRKSHDKSLPE